MDLIPENLERLTSAQVRSYVAKLSHLYIVDNDHLFSIFFKFSTKGSESTQFPRAKTRRSIMLLLRLFCMVKFHLSVRSYVLLCIVLYYPNKATLPFFQTRLQTVNVRAHELFFQSPFMNFVQVYRITVF